MTGVQTCALPISQEAQPAAVGLRGILPANAPAGLLEDDFLTLGESWGTWSKGAAAAVAAFYDNEKLDAAGQRAALGVLKTKLSTMEKAINDVAYTAIFDKLSTQYGRLSRRVIIAEAALDTLEINPATAQQARIQAARTEVAAAATQLDSYLGTIDGSQPWFDYAKVEVLRNFGTKEVSADVLNVAQQQIGRAHV